MRLISLIFAVGLAVCVSARAANTVPVVITSAVQLIADTSSPGAAIPADFVGFSNEVGGCFLPGDDGLLQGYWTASNTSLVSLIGNWFPNSNWRFGGGSSQCATAPALTALIANNLAAFLSAGATAYTATFYDLDLTANDTGAATAQTGYLVSALGSGNVIINVGNEADASDSPYHGNEPAYITAFNGYYTVVNGAQPGQKWAGPEAIGYDWLAAFTPTPTPTNLDNHYYGLSNSCQASLTVAKLLATLNSDNTDCGTRANLAHMKGVIGTPAQPWRITEMNSVAGCGTSQATLCQSAASAAWLVGAFSYMAQNGWVGFNIHGLGTYSPIALNGDGTWSPNPIFYGMALAGNIAGHQLLAAPVQVGTGQIKSIATLGTNGKAEILAVNIDTANTLPVYFSQVAAWTTGTVLQMTAPSCTSNAVTLGGSAIGAGGSWSGAAVAITPGTVIPMPPCSAVLFRVTA